MMAPKGPPAKGAGGPIPGADAPGTVEETPLATAGGTRPPAITAGGPPPGTGVPGGTEESSSVTQVELHSLRWHGESNGGKQHQTMGKSRPQRSTIPIAYLHNQSYYIDPNPSTVCFQRQHQGELCPSSHACSNSTYNTYNIVIETEGTTGTGLLAGRDILPNEIIAVFGNAIILQDRGLVQEFTRLINTYNMDHPTRGFQYSIFYPVAGDSYPSVVIPDLDRKLAHGLPNLSKRLRARLRNGSSMAGLAHLANHTCCPHHRNSELQILSVWQEDRTSAILQGPAGEGSGARNSTVLGRTLVASLRATKFIQKGTPVLTCYRNTSSAGTQAQLIKERETLSRMFQCSCCLCGGLCGGSSSEAGLGHAAPSFLLDPEAPASGVSNTDSKPLEKVEIA